MPADPYSPANQWLALTRIQKYLPTLVGPAGWQGLDAALPALLARLATGNDDQVRLAAAVDLQDRLAPYPTARARILAELHIQAGLQTMLDAELHALATTLGVDASTVDASLAAALQFIQADLAEPVQPADRPRLVKIGVGGVDGGKVVRLSNLTVDLGDLSELLAGSVITGYELVGPVKPLVVVASLLLIIRGVQKAISVELSEVETSVFWGLIQVCGRDKIASEAEITHSTNQERARYSLPALDGGRIHQALRRLEQLRTIRSVVHGGWQLVDRYAIGD